MAEPRARFRDGSPTFHGAVLAGVAVLGAVGAALGTLGMGRAGVVAVMLLALPAVVALRAIRAPGEGAPPAPRPSALGAMLGIEAAAVLSLVALPTLPLRFMALAAVGVLAALALCRLLPVTPLDGLRGVPDLLVRRGAEDAARRAWKLVAMVVSVALLGALLAAFAQVAGGAGDWPPVLLEATGGGLGLLVVLGRPGVSPMRAGTALASAGVLALLLAAVWWSGRMTGVPVPQVAVGGLLQELAAAGLAPGARSVATDLATVAVAALGIAALPRTRAVLASADGPRVLGGAGPWGALAATTAWAVAVLLAHRSATGDGALTGWLEGLLAFGACAMLLTALAGTLLTATQLLTARAATAFRTGAERRAAAALIVAALMLALATPQPAQLALWALGVSTAGLALPMLLPGRLDGGGTLAAILLGAGLAAVIGLWSASWGGVAGVLVAAAILVSQRITASPEAPGSAAGRRAASASPAGREAGPT